MDSRVEGFYKASPDDRLAELAKRTGLSADAEEALSDIGLTVSDADQVSENVVGTVEYPLSVATNFVVNGRDTLVPMAVEETSVVAAASYGARMVRPTGGFAANVSGLVMIAQIQAKAVSDPHAAKVRILEHADELIERANEQDPVLVEHGGGCRDMNVRVIDTQ